MKKCGPDGFNFQDKESLEYIGVKDYYCPQIKNYSIYGQFYSDIFRYISLKVTKCKNTTSFNECKPTEEIDEYIIKKQAQLSFIFVNSYFDSNSYDKPIKSYLDDTFYWTFLYNYNKLTNIYFKKNQVQLSDTYLSGLLPEEDLNYYEIQNSRESLEPLGPDEELMQVFFRFDDQFDNYERAIYGISDFMGDVGGF